MLVCSHIDLLTLTRHPTHTYLLMQGYEGCLYVIGQYPEPPDKKHWVHWTVVQGGVQFAVEVTRQSSRGTS